MRSISSFFSGLALPVVLLIFWGCDKEKIVTTTEYVHDTKYIEMPPDTVRMIDTVFSSDTSYINGRDTVFLLDTIYHNSVIYDTIRITTIIHDTVLVFRDRYDTVIIIDTVLQTQFSATSPLAVAAMTYHTDPLVFDFVNREYGWGEGYIFYITPSQMDIAHPSANVYDIYGYLEYYSSNWANYVPIEFYWRITYRSGDPSNPNNWQMSEPPSAISVRQPGLNSVTGGSLSPRSHQRQ